MNFANEEPRADEEWEEWEWIPLEVLGKKILTRVRRGKKRSYTIKVRVTRCDGGSDGR
jgi:hypothetical protein